MIKLYNRDNNINLVVKTSGNACNINCSYCFEQVKNVAHNIITPNILRKTLENIPNTCSIIFHGGEPLIIGKKKFSELLDVTREFFPHKIIAVRIQTNGTLLDEEWLDIIYSKYADLEIEIAISLDGTEYMNRLRIDYYGNSTFDSVRKAFRLLESRGKQAGMLSVISKGSLPYFKEYIDFIASIPNVRFVKINALFNMEGTQLTSDSITPQEYASFIIDSSFYYVQSNLYQKIAIEPFLSILQSVNCKASRYCNYSCTKCYNYLSLYPDGSIGPCDCLSVNDFYITNVNELENKGIEDLITITTNSKSTNVLTELINECKNCDILSFCTGGCISQRFYLSKNKMLKKEYCDAKHKLYDAFRKFTIVNKELQ